MSGDKISKNVIPKRYKLELKPDLELCIFKGKCTIDIEIRSCVEQIILNAADLIFDYADLTYTDDPSRTIPIKISTDREGKQQVVFSFRDFLHVGRAVLRIHYVGTLNSNLEGFYRTADGAATQFEENDARKCFPCWDCPCYRTPFDVVLTSPAHLTTLSNMPTADVERLPSGDSVVYTFESTPKMSTYLLAFVIGEYEYVEGRAKDGYMIRVYTPLGRKCHGQMALEAALKLMEFYTDYLGVGYNLPKLDLVSVTRTAVGAMENWGLVTFNEGLLLADKNSSASDIRSVYLVIAHELAHLWFGDLVTIANFNETWLKESFAACLQTMSCLALFPQYDHMSRFFFDLMFPALEFDASAENDQPADPDQIRTMSTISKGAVILRMIKQHIGEEDFRKSLHTFVRRHKMAACVTQDLWNVFDEVSGKAVGTLMSTWTKRTGFPLLSATSRQQNGNRVLTLTQRKFQHDVTGGNGVTGGCPDKGGQREGEKELWQFPISLIAETSPCEPVISTIMDSATLTISLCGIGEHEWIKLNPGTVCFCRVLYTPEELKKLGPVIKCQKLCPLDRLGILSDVIATVRAGYIPITQLLELLDYYVEETEFSVWSLIVDYLRRLRMLMMETHFLDKFDLFCLDLLRSIRAKAIWTISNEDQPGVRLLSQLILKALVEFGDQEALKEAHCRFLNHTTMVADLGPACYAAAMIENTKCNFHKMIELFRLKKDDTNDREVMLLSMGRLQDPALLRAALDFMMSDEISKQLTPYGLRGMGSTPAGRHVLWQYFQDNREKFIQKFAGTFYLPRVIDMIISPNVCTGKGKKIQKYFEDNPIEGAQSTVEKSLANIRKNSDLLKRYAPAVEEFLEKRKSKAECA